MTKPQTPYFSLDPHALHRNLSLLKTALNTHFPKHIIGYSFKTNTLPWVLGYMRDQGCFAEVVSHHEYDLAQHMGYKHIVYNGPMKDEITFAHALKAGHIVNVETWRELEWLKHIDGKKNVGVRVNFDIEAHCPNESHCGKEGGRFGFCFENGELAKAILALQNIEGVSIVGLHLHTTSTTRSVHVYETLAQMAETVSLTYSLNLDYVDIGGGFFGGMPTKPSFDTYLKVIKQKLGTLSEKTLIIEPGSAVVGAFFSYTCQVIDVKDTSYNRFVVLDGTRGHVDPFFRKKNYLLNFHAQQQKTHYKQVLCGFTCVEDDRFCTLENEVELSVGDTVTFLKVGNYTISLVNNFIKFSPAVYLEDDGTLKTLKKAWGVAEFLTGNEMY